MVKRAVFVVLIGVSLMLGFSARAVARSNPRQNAPQLQTSRQQGPGNHAQASFRLASGNEDGAAAQNRHVLVGKGRRQHLIIAQSPQQLLASSIIGVSVENKAGTIGTASDLAISRQHLTSGVVVDLAGTMGLSGKRVDIPREAVQGFDPQQEVLTVAVSQQWLQDAPDFSIDPGTQVLATTVIGMSIENRATTLGNVSDLIMNEQHRIIGVVVDMTGILGLIGQHVGLSWNAVKDMKPKQGILTVTVTQQQLQDAPSFTTRKDLDRKTQDQDPVMRRYLSEPNRD